MKVEKVTDSNGNMLYGLDAELATKARAKYDAEFEKKVLEWIYKATETPFPTPFPNLYEGLKDGVLLCR
jgi:hypothetical protein